MKNEYYQVECWLRRTWDLSSEIKELENRKEEILTTMSGVGKYDAKAVKGGCDTNPTETKNLEYSSVCEKIERLQNKLSAENARTLDAIYKIDDAKSDLRTMLIAYSINRIGWKQLGKKRNYEKTASYEHRDKCLEAVFPFVPKEAFINEDNSHYSV